MSDKFTGTHRVILPKDFFDPSQTFFGEDFDVEAENETDLKVHDLKPTVSDKVRKLVGNEIDGDADDSVDLDVPGW